TTAGTPVKSCINTRAGIYAISRDGSALGSQLARKRMSSAVTVLPSSCRSKFSSRMRSEKGSRERFTPSSALRLKYSTACAPELSVAAALKLLGCCAFDIIRSLLCDPRPYVFDVIRPDRVRRGGIGAQSAVAAAWKFILRVAERVRVGRD